ncbi:acetyltransferase [Clostridia bacterium]|nr:acetyltransferase [Clostridia bacterium]
MDIRLQKATPADAETLRAMQAEAFAPLLEKYQDRETSPALETTERILQRLQHPALDWYLLCAGDRCVGAIRVLRKENSVYRVGGLFVLPACQRRGYATAALAAVEARYPDALVWELDTIAQEAGNCRLYERIGYRRTGEASVVNERMTLVAYEKQVQK